MFHECLFSSFLKSSLGTRVEKLLSTASPRKPGRHCGDGECVVIINGQEETPDRTENFFSFPEGTLGTRAEKSGSQASPLVPELDF